MPRPIYSTSALLSSISPARLPCVYYFHADPHHLIWVAGVISMLIDKSRLNYRRMSFFFFFKFTFVGAKIAFSEGKTTCQIHVFLGYLKVTHTENKFWNQYQCPSPCSQNLTSRPSPVTNISTRGAHNLGARSSGRINFLMWPLIFFVPQYGIWLDVILDF